MPTGDRKDPFRGFNFRLEIGGVMRAGFHECSGLDEGDFAAARKLPGQTKYSPIILTNGSTDDKKLLQWRQEASAHEPERKNGSIILMDENDAEKTRWNFVSGWPRKWDGPSFSATANDVAIEMLELEHEGLTKA